MFAQRRLLILVVAMANLIGDVATRGEDLENLAQRAQVWASSEYSDDYRAAEAIDGEISPALSKQDARQAWCVRGSETHGKG